MILWQVNGDDDWWAPTGVRLACVSSRISLNVLPSCSVMSRAMNSSSAMIEFNRGGGGLDTPPLHLIQFSGTTTTIIQCRILH